MEGKENKYSLDTSFLDTVKEHQFHLIEHSAWIEKHHEGHKLIYTAIENNIDLISKLNVEVIKIKKKLFDLSIIVFFELAIMLGLLLLFVLK